MRYLSHTSADIESMLTTAGKSNLNSLFASIPSEFRLEKDLNLPKAQTELELKDSLRRLSGAPPRKSFLGAGSTAHFVPEIVSQQLLRGEWLTAYTPYQPEVSQGTLQAIFEFQTMVASLFGCEVANASMYDGATALAEAALMACRLKPQAKTIVISRAVHPEYRQVCRNIVEAAGFHVVEVEMRIDGRTQFSKQIESTQDVAATVYQTPNFFGQLEPQKDLISWTHSIGAISIAVTTEPTALGVIQSPGFAGADIVVGEGIGFCGHQSLGAPGVGLFATSNQFIRQMPGRLAGQTVDTKGKRGFVLTLSTREQHIRRQKATSNICTNHNLMALAFSMSLSLYGKEGFAKLAQRNIQKTMYFRKLCNKYGLKVFLHGPHFNETVIQFESKKHLADKMKQMEFEQIFPGVLLERWYPQFDRHLMVSTTELHTDEDLEYLAKNLS